MGNCIRHEGSSGANWGGEDWGSLANDGDQKRTRKPTLKKIEEEEEKGLLGGEDGMLFGSYNSSSTKMMTTVSLPPPGGATEVKIKMTKKELEELMGRVELKQMTVQQVLAQLIISVSSSDAYENNDQHNRPWRPVLQSIPEVN